MYHEAAVRDPNSGPGLSQAGIVLIAILAGGDYDSVSPMATIINKIEANKPRTRKTGLRGCSFNMARTLARTTSLGHELMEIMQGNHQLVEFDNGYFLSVRLSEWRSRLRTELKSNHHLSRRQPALAASIPETFPQPEILDLYINPAIAMCASQLGCSLPGFGPNDAVSVAAIPLELEQNSVNASRGCVGRIHGSTPVGGIFFINQQVSLSLKFAFRTTPGHVPRATRVRF